MDAQVTPANHVVQGTYSLSAQDHRAYRLTLDIHTKDVGAIQRGKRSENTSRYQRDCVRRQQRA